MQMSCAKHKNTFCRHGEEHTMQVLNFWNATMYMQAASIPNTFNIFQFNVNKLMCIKVYNYSNLNDCRHISHIKRRLSLG